MKQIEDKIDKLIEKQEEMNVTLARQEVNLKEHMRRTEILEDELKPVVKHVAMIKGAGILVALLGTLAGIFRSLGK